MIKENLIKIFETSFKCNWDRPATTDYETNYSLTYGEFAAEIERLHILYNKIGINQGDKIAVSGKNSTAWALVYMSTITYGAVIVPILDEFNVKDINHIINHSDSKLFFCDNDLWVKMNDCTFETLMGTISLKDKKMLWERDNSPLSAEMELISYNFNIKHKNGFTADSISYPERSNSELAVLCYTSGTTSMTKGVMLSGNNIAGNVMFGRRNYIDKLGVDLKSTIALLPLAHTYGTAFSLLVQLEVGAEITFLGKIPSPHIVMEACNKVKPTLLFFVPLILEKIYKNKIQPTLKKPIVSFLLKVPLINTIIYRSIGRKMRKMFGGSALEEVIVGGAAINSDVEKFFYKTRFPFLIGYGMTECGPLISYINHKEFIPGSVGKALPGTMEVRIKKDNYEDAEGEIQVRGENVMMGYYKDEAATRATFTKDGWLKTGDLGKIDKMGNIYICGRSKTMLLGPSGENIYPEHIESKLSNMPFVSECILVQHNSRLEAWVYPDMEAKEKMQVSDQELSDIMNDNRLMLNQSLARFEAVNAVRIASKPFPKTPKRTIKRYVAAQEIMEAYQEIV